MEEIIEISGQAILACLAAIAIMSIAIFVVFRVDVPYLTMGKFIFETLDSLLP